MPSRSSDPVMPMVDLTEADLFREYPAHQNPDVRAYRRAIQADPCVYCGGPGGTLEHLAVRGVAQRWDVGSWAGACSPCNAARSRGGRGGRGEHRTLLQMLMLRDRERTRWLRMHPEALLAVGDEVRTPKCPRARVTALPGGAVVELELLEQGSAPERTWTCTDVLYLRACDGGPLPRLSAAVDQWARVGRTT